MQKDKFIVPSLSSDIEWTIIQLIAFIMCIYLMFKSLKKVKEIKNPFKNYSYFKISVYI